MSDREQFILRQAAKFDDRVRNELGMSVNDVLKAFSEGRLKDNNIEQQLKQAHRAGWEQCKVQIVAEWEKPYGLTDGTAFINRLRSMEYKGLKNCVEK